MLFSGQPKKFTPSKSFFPANQKNFTASKSFFPANQKNFTPAKSFSPVNQKNFRAAKSFSRPTQKINWRDIDYDAFPVFRGVRFKKSPDPYGCNSQQYR
jgi:hypothetical protein